MKIRSSQSSGAELSFVIAGTRDILLDGNCKISQIWRTDENAIFGIWAASADKKAIN